ncbi:MAG: hypothetical protein KC620_18720, partial [Myxococcales bacterium]|nr:hypothetical protein [Myxococcales bacterium]
MIVRALLAALLLAAPASLRAAAPKADEAVLVEGALARSEVRSVIERGPQRFIASLRVAAHLEKGRFVGFRIEGFAADAPMVNSQSVQPGDVILSVNREPLERPEQFMRAWEVVKEADTL